MNDSFSLDEISGSFLAEGGGLDKIVGVAQKEAKDSNQNKEPVNIGEVFQRQTQDFKRMNDLQKYKEIQRRTKLLYGVKDVRKMISKADET